MEGSSGHIGELFKKYRQGVATPEEKVRMTAYFYQRGRHAELERLLDDAFGERPPEDWDNRQEVQMVLDRVRERIDKRLPEERPASTHRRRILRWLPYAAAVLVLAAGLFFWEQGQRSEEQELAATEILPGGNRATLTLADGRTIDLSEAQKGIIIGDGITYLDGSAVTPADSAPGPENGSLRTTDYILSTPKGGTYQVALPDGSKVWLNAASTLKYPGQFANDERRVELSGEAYFAIEQDSKRPFRVISTGQEIIVLGTQFNISAYSDESETKTTLVEGSVKVALAGASRDNTPDPSPTTFLAPGQQSILSNGQFTKHNVDVHSYIGWKDNQFIFHHVSLRQVMAQLQRWYDIEVDLRTVPDKALYGEITRDVPLSQVLDMIEEVSGITFEMKERRLRISE